MVYLLNQNFNEKKLLLYELKKLFGISLFQGKILLLDLNFGLNTRIVDMTQLQYQQLVQKIEKKKIVFGNDLIQHRGLSIAKLIETKTYKGLKHIVRLNKN